MTIPVNTYKSSPRGGKQAIRRRFARVCVVNIDRHVTRCSEADIVQAQSNSKQGHWLAPLSPNAYLQRLIRYQYVYFRGLMGVRVGEGGREGYQSKASLWFPNTSPLSQSVHLLPFSSYFDGSFCFPPTHPPAHPSKRYDNTVLEAPTVFLRMGNILYKSFWF